MARTKIQTCLLFNEFLFTHVHKLCKKIIITTRRRTEEKEYVAINPIKTKTMLIGQGSRGKFKNLSGYMRGKNV